MLRWNAFITNIEYEVLDSEKICQLYRIRWQIELLFKGIKSSLSFDKFGLAGYYYFKCLLYGKLILIITVTELFTMCRSILYKKTRRLVSIQSFFRNIRGEINLLIKFFKNEHKINNEKIYLQVMRIAELSLFDKRKRKTSEEIFIFKKLESADNSNHKLVS